VAVGELVNVVHKALEGVEVLIADAKRRVNEDVGNVVIACKDARNEAVKSTCVKHEVFVNVDKSAARGDIVAKLDTLLNANDAALGFGNSLVDKVDKILGFSGAFYSSDKFNHFIPPGFRGLQYYYTIIN
jgi:hypothetical protein